MRGFLGRAGYNGLSCLGVTRGLGPCVEEQPAVQPAPPLVTGVGPGPDELVDIITPVECSPGKVLVFAPLRRQAPFTFECVPAKELRVAGAPGSNNVLGTAVVALVAGVALGAWLNRRR